MYTTSTSMPDGNVAPASTNGIEPPDVPWRDKRLPPSKANEECMRRWQMNSKQTITKEGGLQTPKKALLMIFLVLQTLQPGVEASFAGPLKVGLEGAPYCDTIGTAFDVFQGTTDEYIIGGVTYSEKFIQGSAAYTNVAVCTTYGVPFFQFYKDSAVLSQRFFTDIVSVNGITGRYSEIAAMRWPDRRYLSSAYFQDGMVVALKFTDLSGTLKNEGTSFMWFRPASATLERVLLINTYPPTKDEFAWYNTDSSDSANSRCVILRSRQMSPVAFKYYYLNNLDQSLKEYWNTYIPLEESFGAHVVIVKDENFIIGGTMTTSSFSGYFPVMYWQGTGRYEWIVPDVASQPYHSLDKLVFDELLDIIYGFGVPRDASFNILDSTNPTILIRRQNEAVTGCQTETYFFSAIYVKFQTPEAAKFLIPIDISFDFPDDIQMAFLRTSTLNDYTLDGSENHYIAQLEAPNTFKCNGYPTHTVWQQYGSGTFQDLPTTTTALTASLGTYYEYYGRNCYTPTGISSYCTFVAGKYRYTNTDNREFFFMTNQKRYYQDLSYNSVGLLLPTDDTSKLTIDNGDASTQGQFIVVNHNIDTYGPAKTSYYRDHATYGSAYDKIFYDILKQYHGTDIAIQSLPATMPLFGNCDSNVYSITDSTASGVLASGTNSIQVFTGDSSGSYLEIVNPFSISCSGFYCTSCLTKERIEATSDSTGATLTQPTAYIPLRVIQDPSDQKLQVPWVDKATELHYTLRLLHYTLSQKDETTTLNRASQFTLSVNVGPFYLYPSCSPYCLHGGVNQFQYRIYKKSTQCYEALSTCAAATCLDLADPSTMPLDIRPMTCPTRICTASDTLEADSSVAMLEFDKDIVDLPISFDLASAILNPQSLNLEISRVGNGTGLSFVYPNSSYTGLFTSSGTTVTLNTQSPTQYEFYGERFTLEVKATTCTTIDDSVIADASRPAIDSPDNLLSIGILFQVSIINCNSQVFTLTDATEKYFEIQKNTNDHTLFTHAQKVALFTLTDSINCQIVLYQILNSAQTAFTTFNPHYSNLKLSTWTSLDDIVISSNFQQITTELQWVIEFNIAAETRGKNRYGHIKYQTVKVVLGCFAETTITASIKTISNANEIFRYTDLPDETATGAGSFVKILLLLEQSPNLADSTSYLNTYNLDDLIQWTTDIDNCFVSNVTLCDDAACATISSATNARLASNPTNKDTSGLVVPSLIIDRRASFAKYLYVKGSTNSGLVSDIFKINLVVCGGEELVFNNPTYILFDALLYKTTTNQEYILTSIYTIVTPYPNMLATDCPIVEYFICTTTPCTTSNKITATDLFIISGSTLNVVRSTELRQTTFYISAITGSGVSMTQPFKLRICGYEVITASTGAITIEQDIYVDTSSHSFKFADIFTNSEEAEGICMITKYQTLMQNSLSGADIADNQKVNIILTHDQIQIVPNIVQNIKFYLVASTDANQFAAKEFIINIIKIIPPPNQLPKYASLQSEFTVGVVYDIDNVPENTAKETFKSPTPTDEEGDKIILTSFTGFDEYSFITVTINTDLSFAIEVDRSLIMKSSKGDYEFKVALSDSENPDKSNEQTMNVKIEYTKLEPVKETTNSDFVFDGIANQQDSQGNGEEGEGQKIENPTAWLGGVTQEGQFSIFFDQDMVTPSGLILSYYQQSISFKMLSTLDGSSVVGTQRKTEPEAKRELQGEDEYDYSFVEETEANLNLQFNVLPIEHSKREIRFQIDFEKPKQVSSTNFGKDQLEIRLINLDFFISEQTLKPVLASSFKGGIPIMTIDLPPQITDKQVIEGLKDGADTGGSIINFLSTGNFFVSLILGGSMQQLWGMIRALQLIVLSSLVQVNYPPHAIVFFQTCMLFAQMDILKCEDFYEEEMVFKETPALTPQFEMYDIDSMNFFLNSGSFVVIQMGIILYFLGKWTINRLCTFFYQSEQVRKVGIYMHEKNYLQGLISSSQKLFLESYFDIAMCSILNTLAISRSKSWKDFLGFMEGRDNILNITLGTLCFVMTCWFPYYTYKVIQTQFKVLDKKATREKYLVFYDEIRVDTFIRAHYNTIFMIRRFLIVIVLIFMNGSPFFQCNLLMIFSTMNIVYLISQHPLSSPRANQIEVFNEFCIVLCSHTVTTFLNAAIPIELRDELGWILIGISGINIIINLAITGVDSVIDVYKSRKHKQQVEEFNQLAQKKMQNRSFLTQSVKGQFHQFEHQIDIFKGIWYCREWWPHRQWMLANKIDPSRMSEEVRFQEIMKEHKFLERAQKFKLTEGIDYACEEVSKQKITDHKLEILRNQYNRELKDKEILVKPVVKAEDLKQKLRVSFKTMVSLEEFEQKEGMKTIQEVTEDLKSSDTSSQEEFDIIVKTQKEEILKTELLNDFKPKVEWFDFKPEIDVKQLDLLEQYYANRKEEMPEKLQMIIIDERMKYGETLKSIKRHQKNYMLRREDRFSLDFFVNDDEDDFLEYGDEIIEKMTLNPQEVVDHYLLNRGTALMTESGKNNYLQAVFQVLVEIQNFKLYFVRNNFLKGMEQTMPVSSALGRLFKDVYAPQLEILKEGRKVSMEPVHDILEDIFQVDQNENANLFYWFVLNQLEAETTPPGSKEFDPLKHSENIIDYRRDNKKRNSEFYDSLPSIFSKEFSLLVSERYQCVYGHYINQYSVRKCITIDPMQHKTFKRSVDDYFGIKNLEARCNECENGLLQEIKARTELRILPETIIINVELLDEQMMKKEVAFSIPQRFNFKRYVYEDDEKDIKKGYVMPDCEFYECFAIVAMDGPSLDFSFYEAVIKKHDLENSTFQWYEFNSKGLIKIKEEQALLDYRPHLIFYRRPPKKLHYNLQDHNKEKELNKLPTIEPVEPVKPAEPS